MNKLRTAQIRRCPSSGRESLSETWRGIWQKIRCFGKSFALSKNFIHVEGVSQFLREFLLSLKSSGCLWNFLALTICRARIFRWTIERVSENWCRQLFVPQKNSWEGFLAFQKVLGIEKIKRGHHKFLWVTVPKKFLAGTFYCWWVFARACYRLITCFRVPGNKWGKSRQFVVLLKKVTTKFDFLLKWKHRLKLWPIHRFEPATWCFYHFCPTHWTLYKVKNKSAKVLSARLAKVLNLLITPLATCFCNTKVHVAKSWEIMQKDQWR